MKYRVSGPLEALQLCWMGNTKVISPERGARDHTNVRAAGSMNLIPDRPPSEEEIGELDVFLMSDATPDDCMDIVALDGFLTALVIGPKLVPPSVWLPLVWGDEEAPAFESSVQAERIIGLVMRRYDENLPHVR
jgi:hypothetical protein